MRPEKSCLLILVFCNWLSMPALADIDPDSFPDEIRALQWREVGPYRGGRAAAVAGISRDRNTYYFGATGGGVWKTLDAGKSWRNVSDGYFGGSIGAVAVSEWDPNVIYVGGGEKTVRGNVSPGDGMWKSTDAGDTWRRIGLEDSQHVSRIRIHPTNPDLAYAAVMGHLFDANEQRGIFRTRNGGESWERVMFVSNQVGAVDLAMDPVNPRILYASFWRVLRTPYSLESGGEGSGIYKSSDGGDSWTNLTANDGLPKGTLGIIGIDVSQASNSNVYAMIEAENGGVFRSQDGGKTWVRTNEERSLRQRAWYYTRIYADPADDESVYVLNVKFHHSKDGGKSFSEIETPHGDNHDLWIDPADPRRMIEANDGGANVSDDGGATWSTQSNQPTAQFYRVSTDNAFPYRLLGGQQDNSAVRIRSRSAFGDAIDVRDWETTAGGESGHIVAKPDNPDIVVGGSYGGYLRILDHRSGQSRSIDVWPDNPMGWSAADIRYRFQWNFPIAFSKHDPDVLFVAANVLFQSEDSGQSWRAVSPDLTRNDKSTMGPSGGPITRDNTSVEYYGTIFAIAESHHEPDVIWAGSDDGKVQLTRNGGTTWADVTPSKLPQWAQVNSIEVHPFERGGAYLAATRYKSGDFRPYLFKTTDWGASWSRITNGIPLEHFTRVLRADPDREGLLYAGTERGIYYSLDDGAKWQALQLNLPIVPITDLAIKNQDLIAATQGRGFWILDDLSVLHQVDSRRRDAVHLYAPRASHRLAAGGSQAEKPVDAGSNPQNGTVFYYALGAEPAAETAVSLEIFSAQQPGPIWTWTRKPLPPDEDDSKPGKNDPPETRVLDARAGLNRHTWDLRYPGMERFDNLILWNDLKSGPVAVPGSYRARLSVGAAVQEVLFEVRADPRSTSSQEDYLAQFSFVIECRDLLSRVHREIKRVRALRSQFEELKKRLEESPQGEASASLLEEISAIDLAMTDAEEALYQTSNESEQDPLNFPIRLNDKLSAVMRQVASGDAPPTSQAIAVKSELSSAIAQELARLDDIWASRLPAFNASVRDAGMDFIALPEQ
ncbi:MAG: glycosyl hydrolase [Gammaproteobacteria bacterium]|nr:glycosyl hydrolase [Gammaproteobacteria bacterium]